jgi:hypothetical protein
LGKGRGLVDSITVQKSLRVGVAGSDVKELRRYTPTLSPAAVGANTTAEQTFTVAGVAVGDVVISVVKPTAQAGLGIVGARISASDTLAITFSNNTGGSITPTASQVYQVLVWRP